MCKREKTQSEKTALPGEAFLVLFFVSQCAHNVCTILVLFHSACQRHFTFPFQKVTHPYGHLTPGRPCFVPPRFVRSPAFNPFRPLPHFDGPAFIATALALRTFLPRAAAAILEAAAVVLATCLRAAIPRAAAAIFEAAVLPPSILLNRPFLVLRGGVTRSPGLAAGRSTEPPVR